MANRPISYPEWPLSGPNVQQPSSELSGTGWAPGVAPDAQNFNWLLGDSNAWIKYLDQLTNTGIPLSVIRLINGGTWSFNATSGVFAWSAAANLAIPSLSDASNNIPAGSVTLADGQVAYTVANLPTNSQGDTSTSSNLNKITNINFTGNISVNDAVTGPGIPGGTTVIGVGANFVTLSANVTSNNTQATYTFAPVGNLSVQVANNIALMPTINTILLARRSGNVLFVGVNCSQMVLRDGEFKTLIGSGYFSVYEAPAGQNLTKGTLCYISPGAGDGGRTTGALYPLDVSAANQAIRGTYAGVVITDVTTSQTSVVLYSGFFAETSLVAGDNYYADPAVPGGITNVAPSGAGDKITPIGFSVTSTILLFTGVSAGIAGPSAFPIFKDEYLTDTGDHQHYTLSTAPLSDEAIFLFSDGGIIANNLWTRSGLTIDFGSPQAPDFQVYAQYVLAAQSYLSAFQEIPSNPSGDRQTYALAGNPTNKASTFVWVDGEIVDQSLWSLTVSGGLSYVVFNGPLALAQANNVYVAYFSSAAGGGGGGGITGCTNLDGGNGIFAGIVSGIAQFKAIVQGAGTTITSTPDEIIIALSGAGAAPEAHGSFASPLALDPTLGLVPTSAGDQVWWLTTLTASPGVDPITKNPQFAVGTSVGQRLTIFGVTNGSGGYLSVADGNGLLQNGNFALLSGQCIVYMWNGTVWQFISNAI